MNKRQIAARDRLQDKLRSELRIIAEDAGRVFTRVQGVTVIIGPRGGYVLPAVRTYSEGVETAVNARVLWDQQKRRDDAEQSRACEFNTGHLGPLIDIHWKCSNERCKCNSESLEIRRRRSLQVSRKT